MIDPGLLTVAAAVVSQQRRGAQRAPIVDSPTILIVDREAPVREVIGDILQLHGYTTLQAADGEEAIALCAYPARPIDLIIADLIIPGPTGPVLEAKVGATRRGMKMMFMSGYPDELVREHGLLPRCHQFLHKPFSVDELIGKVREVLEQPLTP